MTALLAVAGCSAAETSPAVMTSASPPTPEALLGGPIGPATPTSPPNPAACAALSWDDLPAEVRSPTSKPEPMHAPGGEADCRLDNSIIATVYGTIPTDPRAFTSMTSIPRGYIDIDHPSYFIVRLRLGDGVKVNPSNYDNGEPVDIGGFGGTRARGMTESGAPRCVAAFRTASSGKAAVSVVNARFPGHDVCDLAMGLASALSGRLR